MAGEVTHQSTEDIESELVRRGHVVTSWDSIGEITIEATGVETSSYRIGLPSLESVSYTHLTLPTKA